MSETTFTWLHLTDLHVGMGGGLGNTLWDTFEERLYQDLQVQLRKSPPLDVVLFTGDLTQRGTSEEFEALNYRLDRLWEVFRQSGHEPSLLVVPGNHDLQRPPPHDPAAIALANWWSDRTMLMRQRWFWEAEGAALRAYVDRAFEAYTNWWETCPYVLKDERTRLGLLPGDFAQTLEKDGLRFCVVGLNSAFLQLSDAPFEKLLALDRRQLAHLVEQNEQFYRLSGAHDFALLLTHHPTSWLHPEATRDFYEGIYPPDYFDGHLFGHVHEGAGRSVSMGGSQPRRSLQGASLFGLEDYSLFKDDKREHHQRIHGYGFGALRIDLSSERATLVQKRRRGFRVGDGVVRLSVDDSAMVHDDDTGFSTPEQIDWSPKNRVKLVPGPRVRPKLPFARLRDVLSAQTAPGLEQLDPPLTLQAFFKNAYECGLENRQRAERLGIFSVGSPSPMHIWSTNSRIGRMPAEFGPGCEHLRRWRLLELQANGDWMTTHFARGFYDWCETNPDRTPAPTSDHITAIEGSPLGQSAITLPTDDQIIDMISAWITTSVQKSLFRPLSHSDIDSRLQLPPGSSRRLTAKTVAQRHPPMCVKAETDTVICLSPNGKKNRSK